MALSVRQRGWVVTLAALSAVLLTARLGWWQLDRAAQRAALQAAIDERAQLPAIDSAALLAADAQAALAQHHRRVRLTGHWLAEHTVVLDNRQLDDGRPGFIVLTPLRLEGGSAVLVQRGWQARDFQDRSRVAPVPTPDGAVEVRGRIAPPPPRLYEFSGGDGGRIRQNIDLASFGRETGLALRPLTVLQHDSAATAGDGLQRHWPAPSSGAAKNRGYAFQWFGLSALIVVLYVWFQLIQPHRARR